MSPPSFDDLSPLDPELLELLREIAARQEARLLRPDPPRSVRELFESSSTVSAGATGLLAAERQLLRRHREEVAFLLHALAYRLLQETESFRRIVCRPPVQPAPNDGEHPPSPRQLLEKEERLISASFPGDPQISELLRPIHAGLATQAEPRILAQLSLRLVPSTEARLCIAADLARSGSRAAALSAFSMLCESAPLPAHRACADSWRGLLLGRRGDHGSAAEADRESVRRNPGMIAYSCNWLAHAVQAGEQDQILSALSSISEDADPDDRHLHTWLANAYEQRAHGEWTPTLAATSWSMKLINAVDVSSRRILHVFL